ncbi:MAG: histidine phosphatase family protein [Flavisolibacter sp.]
MKINVLIVLITLTAILFPYNNSYSRIEFNDPDIKIIIIRHGEKPDKGDNLSCQGLNRALQLPSVIKNKFGLPDKIFVPTPNSGKSTSTSRMYQTIVPFAIKYNLKINTKYDVKDTKAIAEALGKESGTVLLVWEHKAILKIVKAIGVDDPGLSWDDNDFDSIWIISYKNGKPVLTKDRENIKPLTSCP